MQRHFVTDLIPGDPWQPAIERALAESETCAVFVGPSGLGPWQNEEMRAAIDRRVSGSDSSRRFRVIPVLLPGADRPERSSLPTFLVATTWVEFRPSVDEPHAFHRLVCGIRGVEPGAGPGQAIYEGRCPYRGLRVFDVEDASFFFGREALVEWLVNAIRPAPKDQAINRFLAIVGASGSGKSSVARAGLAAALKQEAVPGSSQWPIAIFRPGADPLESLAVALSSVANIGQGALALSDLIEGLQKMRKRCTSSRGNRREWEASHPGELSADEAEFLRCSLEAQQQREATELEAARKLADALKERAEPASGGKTLGWPSHLSKSRQNPGLFSEALARTGPLSAVR